MQNNITLSANQFQELISKIENFHQHVTPKGKAPKDPILDNADVLQLLKISKRTLQSWRDENKLAFSKVNGLLFYRLSDIEDLINRNYHKRLV